MTNSDTTNNDSNTTTSIIPDVKLGLGLANNPSTNTKTTSKSNINSDDSGWDDSDDSDSSGFNDDDDDDDNDKNGTHTNINMKTTSIPSESESLELEVEGVILPWARGKGIVQLIQTLTIVYSGELPDLGPLWSSSSLPTNDPTEIRKCYLKVIRYCHPDKLPHHVPIKQRIEATKLFSLLAEAYSHYKQQQQLT